MRLKDKVAVVTGAGSGLGRAISVKLAAEGCRVAIADISLKNAEETVQLIFCTIMQESARWEPLRRLLLQISRK